MNETRARAFMMGACLLSLVGFLTCSSPPNPGPNGPGGAGGAPLPPAVTCAEACQVGAGACSTFDEATCLVLCPGFSAKLKANLAVAKNCPDVTGADPGAAPPGIGKPIPSGR